MLALLVQVQCEMKKVFSNLYLPHEHLVSCVRNVHVVRLPLGVGHDAL